MTWMLLVVLGGGCAGRGEGPDETDQTDTEPVVCERYAEPAVLEQPFIDAWCPWAGECPDEHGTYESCVEAMQIVFDAESMTYDPCQAEACLDQLAAAESCTVQEAPEPCRSLFEF